MNLDTLVSIIVLLWQVAPGRFLLCAVALFLVCFWGFTAYKVRREKRGYLRWYEWVIGIALGLIGGILDVAINYGPLSLVYGELPASGHYTITKRINGYQDAGRWWNDDPLLLRILRRTLTRIIRVIANLIDPGHIRRRRRA